MTNDVPCDQCPETAYKTSQSKAGTGGFTYRCKNNHVRFFYEEPRYIDAEAPEQ